MARLKSVFFVSLVLVLICPLSAAERGEFPGPGRVLGPVHGPGRIRDHRRDRPDTDPGPPRPGTAPRAGPRRDGSDSGEKGGGRHRPGRLISWTPWEWWRPSSGVTDMRDYWNLPHITEGLASGKVANLGLRSSMDLEKLIKLKPELIMTHDESLIPKMTELGIPIVITYGEAAADLETYVNLTRFLAPFFGKQAEALEFVKRFLKTLEEVTAVTKRAGRQPKTIWGDIYEKRVLVEPGHSWAAQLIKAVGGDYLFNPLGLILRRLLRLFVRCYCWGRERESPQAS